MPETTSLRARVAARLSGACIYLGDVDAAARASEQALAVASQCGDRAAVVATLRARQLVRGDPDGTEERCGLAAQMLEIGREASDPETQMWHLWRIDAMFQRGELAGVGRELDQLAWCVEETGGPVARWHLLRYQAANAHAQARFADAVRLANEADLSRAARRGGRALPDAGAGRRVAADPARGDLHLRARHRGRRGCGRR